MEGLDTYALWMIAIFVVGYACIAFEHVLHIDKATSALLMGIICWIIQFAHNGAACEDPTQCLMEHVANICQIVFFLLGALAIVELISVHKGFAIIADAIRLRSKRKLLWVVGILTFFLSSILDNLTTTIVMIALLSKLIDKGETRLIIGGAVVIAANAGGAWTPIGDVTTTMLWIGGQITSLAIIKSLFLPSFISLIAALAIFTFMLEGEFEKKEIHIHAKQVEPKGEIIFFLGIAALMFVPVFKMMTGLPPFMGVLFGLGILWLVTDLLHHRHGGRDHLRMPTVLSNIDFSSLLFFLGILLAIDAMDTAGILSKLAHWLDSIFTNPAYIATFIGLASAIVDNVPLVAASMGMYTLAQYPVDHSFWQLIAFCAGTGGSILIIGSAAGVMFMGLEKVDFFWYMKRITLPALVSYFVGIGVYLLL